MPSIRALCVWVLVMSAIATAAAGGNRIPSVLSKGAVVLPSHDRILWNLALKKDRQAILRARELGAAAVPTLLQLARNANGEVREIALYGLDEVGDSRGSAVYAHALLDSEPMVRGIAMRALQHRPDAAVVDLLFDAYDRSPEPVVRQNVALILGRIGPPAVNPAELARRFKAESDPIAQEGLVVALAKLGDDSARKRFVELLDASRERDRGRFLEHVGYIHERWVLQALMPILDDTTSVLRIGVDGLPGPEYLRACDVAVNLLADLSGAALPFKVDGSTNYSAQNLAQARRVLKDMFTAQ